MAGIDVYIHVHVSRPHTNHGASALTTTKARVATSDILKAANWNTESVSQRLYHKSVDKAAYGRAITNDNSLVDIETLSLLKYNL